MDYKRKIFSLILLLNFCYLSFGNNKPVIDYTKPIPIEKPIPLPEGNIPTQEKWILEKNYTVILEEKIKVEVPLEIITDMEIDTIILDNEEVDIPFEVSLNKKPDKNNYYKLKFSETEIDIDKDGKIDTKIYAPSYINKKVIKDSYVNIKGENISKEGSHSKKVSVTIEVDE